MSKKERLLSNTVILGISAVLSKVIVLFMMPLYTAVLSPSDFGTMDIIVNTAILLIPLVSMGAPEAVFRFLAGGFREGEVLAVGRSLLGIGALLLLLLIPLFWLFPFFCPFAMLLGFYVACSVLHNFVTHILRARGAYFLYGIQQVFCTLLTVTLAFLFLSVYGMGVRGYLLAILLADAITALVLFFYLFNQPRNTHTSARARLFAPMLRYALPLIPTAVLWWVMSYFNHFLLLRHHGAEITGWYAAAGKLPALLSFASGIFLEAWHYAAVRVEEKERGRLFGKIYSRGIALLLVVALGVMLGAPMLVKVLFSPNFGQALIFVPILTVGAFFLTLSSFLSSVYMVKMRSGGSFLTVLLGASLHILLSFLWIAPYGAMGAAGAAVLAYMGVFMLRTAHCRRLLHFYQPTVRLALSSIGLLLTALLFVKGLYLPMIVSALLCIAPFLGEYHSLLCCMWMCVRKILRFSTKKENLS